jgi:hypothetical protein
MIIKAKNGVPPESDDAWPEAAGALVDAAGMLPPETLGMLGRETLPLDTLGADTLGRVTDGAVTEPAETPDLETEGAVTEGAATEGALRLPGETDGAVTPGTPVEVPTRGMPPAAGA